MQRYNNVVFSFQISRDIRMRGMLVRYNSIFIHILYFSFYFQTKEASLMHSDIGTFEILELRILINELVCYF